MIVDRILSLCSLDGGSLVLDSSYYSFLPIGFLNVFNYGSFLDISERLGFYPIKKQRFDNFLIENV